LLSHERTSQAASHFPRVHSRPPPQPHITTEARAQPLALSEPTTRGSNLRRHDPSRKRSKQRPHTPGPGLRTADTHGRRTRTQHTPSKTQRCSFFHRRTGEKATTTNAPKPGTIF
ncbi:unnamed protein product, partial [Ixodes pacificus]